MSATSWASPTAGLSGAGPTHRHRRRVPDDAAPRTSRLRRTGGGYRRMGLLRGEGWLVTQRVFERLSERRACRVLGHARSTHRHRRRVPDDEPRLVARIIALATRIRTMGGMGIEADHGAAAWRGLAGESQARSSGCGAGKG